MTFSKESNVVKYMLTFISLRMKTPWKMIIRKVADLSSFMRDFIKRYIAAVLDSRAARRFTIKVNHIVIVIFLIFIY